MPTRWMNWLARIMSGAEGSGGMKAVLSILKHEVRDVFSSPAGLACLALQSLALGAGFYLAPGCGAGTAAGAPGALFSGDTLAALSLVFAPAYKGAYYCAALVIPLVVARALFRDNGGGALHYLGQVCGFSRLFAAKSLAISGYVFASLLLSVPVVFYWMMLGGAASAAGIGLLYGGLLLLCAVSVALSFAVSSLTRSSNAAAGCGVLAMAVVLYFDRLMEMFGVSGSRSFVSLGTILDQFENGALPVGPAIGIVSAIILLMLFSFCIYSRERGTRARAYRASLVISVILVACCVGAAGYGLFGRTIPAEEPGVSPGYEVMYEEAVKAAGLSWLQGPVAETQAVPSTIEGATISERDRRDLLVLYWAVMPLVLLLIGVSRGIGASRMPDGRKKVMIMAGTWAVTMACCALLQDHYFRNLTWKALPTMREVLPRWIGSVEKALSPGPAVTKREIAVGPRNGPVDPNCLYAGKDYGYLRRFFRKLADLQANRRDTVRIVHYGDSLIWGDCYTKTMKHDFQREFGDGGRGIVPAVETLATALQDHVNRTSPSGFTQHVIRHEFRYGGRFYVRPEVNPMVGFTGEGAFIRGPRTEVRMEASPGAGRITGVTVYLRAPRNGAPLNEYRVNLDYGTGTATRVVTLKQDSTGKAAFVLPPSDRISFNFEGTTGAPCSVDAVNIETGHGIAYSTIVRMGIHMAWLNAVPEGYLAPLRDVNPDLLIFQFGVNEAASLGGFREFTKDELRSQMREWLGRIRRLLPETDVLLIGPPERLRTYQGYPAPMRETYDVQEVQREEAERAGFAYFDTYQCLGGEGQMMNMVSTGLAMNDYTHFTMRGGDRAAGGFYTALMNVYRKKSDRPKLDLALEESRAIRFNSASYAWFLALAVLGGLALRKRPAVRLLFLAGASYYFYISWQVWPVACLAATTVMDYSMARLIKKARDRGGRGTPFLAASLAFNLGLLFTLKYFDFFSDLAGRALHALGYQASVPLLNLLLPVGISFYTFQSLSYTIDVWRGRMEPETSLLRYAQYVSMFTQLLAGPIVKAREFLPALKERAEHFVATHEHFTAAIFLILTGLVKKTGADWLAATIVDRVYESPQMFLPLEILTAVYAYGIQIYGDFSGYTDIAIGSAMLLGFNLTQNFRRPYASLSMSEFWQRWHMSLGGWLGDYLYISLGGNRKRVLFNIGVTMFVCGLWHGAGIPFMLWGLYHGLFLIIERVFGWNKKETANRLIKMVRVFVTLHIVLFGWIIFRCGTWDTFTGVLGSLARLKSGAPNVGPVLLAVMAGFYALHYTPLSWKERLQKTWASLPASLQGLAASCVTVFLYNAATAGIRPFIYFQF
jgi:alginate O-acetyltransferase complex protein AlgI